MNYQKVVNDLLQYQYVMGESEEITEFLQIAG